MNKYLRDALVGLTLGFCVGIVAILVCESPRKQEREGVIPSRANTITRVQDVTTQLVTNEVLESADVIRKRELDAMVPEVLTLLQIQCQYDPYDERFKL